MAALTIPKRHMLESMLHRSKLAPFDAATLNHLRSAGLVIGGATYRKDGKLSKNYEWTITDKGRQAVRDGWYD